MHLLTLEKACLALHDGVHELRIDSRQVEFGDIFVALPSSTGDFSACPSHIVQAVEKGAFAIACPKDLFMEAPCQWIDSENPRLALGQLAKARYGSQNHGLNLVGITGTNGKTTCSYILEHFFQHNGHKVGVMGTVSYRWPGYSQEAPLTTPDCLTLHKTLETMADHGVDMAIMEVSSHALAQERVAGLDFSVALFTNLSQDHLDYHNNFEDYFAAKSRLFLECPNKNKLHVLNGDDAYGMRLAQTLRQAGHERVLTYSLKELVGPGSMYGKILSSSPEGLSLDMVFLSRRGNTYRFKLKSPLIGQHNAANLLCVMTCALGMGFTPEHMACLADFQGVNGRLESIPNKRGLKIFVDYAHTPDALVNVLTALRGAGFTRIITVFGCGGDRDRTKRPLMAQAVAQQSDVVVLTSDNPRTEDPEAILDDIMPGFSLAPLPHCQPHVHREVDRRKALALALGLAQSGDAVLVAGKGHEPYQIIGKTKHSFSDQLHIQQILQEK